MNKCPKCGYIPTPRQNKPVIPDWINLSTWNEFVKMRANLKGKSPLTDGAIKLIIGKLTKFKHQGYDPNEILGNSIVGQWLSVYEPTDQPKPALQFNQAPVAMHKHIETAEERSSRIEKLKGMGNKYGANKFLPKANTVN